MIPSVEGSSICYLYIIHEKLPFCQVDKQRKNDGNRMYFWWIAEEWSGMLRSSENAAPGSCDFCGKTRIVRFRTVQTESVRNQKTGGILDMRRFAFYLSAILFGGFLYGLVEVLFRGYTHVSMFLLGGICFLCIGGIRRTFSRDIAAKKMLLCAGVITLFEFLCGVLVNRCLNLSVWDYSSMPMNVLGQICIPYTAAWCLLALPAMEADRLLCQFAWNSTLPCYVSSDSDAMYASRCGMRKLTNSSM